MGMRAIIRSFQLGFESIRLIRESDDFKAILEKQKIEDNKKELEQRLEEQKLKKQMEKMGKPPSDPTERAKWMLDKLQLETR